MPLDARFLAFVAVSGLLIMTPGPDMALVMRNALQSGRRAASFTAWGVAIGIFVWAAASVAGVAVLLERSAIAFTVLKLAGAAYLVYLGVRSVLAGAGDGHTSEPDGGTPLMRTLPPRAALKQGVLGNLLNPKAGVIFVSIVPQFVRPGDTPLRLILMVVAFETMLLLWLNAYAWAVSRVARSKAGFRARKIMERVTGVVLVGLGLRLALQRR